MASQCFIDSEVKAEMNSILDNLVNQEGFEENLELLESSLSVAKKLDSDLFVNWFSTLDPILDFKASESHCEQCIKELTDRILNYDAGVPLAQDDNGDDDEELPACNCRWSCRDMFPFCTDDKCEATANGCGLLGLWTCNQHEKVCDS